MSVSLRDLISSGAPEVPADTVRMAGQDVEVRPLNVRGVAAALKRFPALRKVLMDAFSGKSLNLTQLLLEAPDAANALIAAGMGLPGDEAAEAWLDQRLFEEQVEALAKVFHLTFQDGFENFMSRLAESLEALFPAEAESARRGKKK